MSVDNLNTPAFDPFGQPGAADDELANNQAKKKGSNEVHIRVQQRNGRKSITSVAGLRQDLDFERVSAAFKRLKGVNGIVVRDEDAGYVLQFTGDVAPDLTEWLVGEKICKKSAIKVFGGKA